MEQKGSPLGPQGDVRQTGQAVQTLFARVAPRYDFLNHLLSARMDVQWRRAAARQLRPILSRAGSMAADLCCGTGDLTFALAQQSAGRVLGADFCHPMLEIARAKRASARDEPSQAAEFVEADTLTLPFRDAALDVVTAAFGFRNLADYERGLREIERVLKPGGVIAILEFSRMQWPVAGPIFRFYFRRVLPVIGTLISKVPGAYEYLPESVRRFPDQESLARSLRDAGFANVRYRNFLGGVAALHTGEKVAR
jgi:demethylmenaquinone methyltransferase / 2-methoxy-6-polyprenyl-1,4-benzoquinol methylase